MTPSPAADNSADPAALERFITNWEASGAAERANYQLFLTQLCDLLDVPQPEPTKPLDADNAYVFERNVTFTESDGSHTTGRIDLYKRGAFVLEAKQGSDAQTAAEAELAELASPDEAAAPQRRKKKGTAVRGTKAWDDAMLRARGQAQRYAQALPPEEGWPPFLIVVDVGHSIELYSEFSRSGKTYVQFPDPHSFRIALADLRKPEVRTRLKQVWSDPLALDPARRSAKVTRELAERLAALAKLLEKAGHDAEDTARFLMRSLFTMFAEDVELIPRGAFKDLLASLRDNPEHFKPAAEDLWKAMNSGGFSGVLRKTLLKFNGGLFAESEALPLNRDMLELLIEAASADWTDVEPAIFGTLLERALDPVERHKLGAHYTPRAYVERLVLPTVIEPLRDDWQAAYAAAVLAAKEGDLAEARRIVHAFHEKLCDTRVLDPACGSGNFLYVTLEQMKRLEGEVLNALYEFGERQKELHEVDPHQFLGIEVNPRAAAIADLVLWIGYLQWHFRTRGHTAPAEPIIKNYKNIECRDAVLAWDRKEAVLDEKLQPVTRWNGRTMKKHPVTGEDVPDETARVLVERYINPRKAEWPAAEFVVGNPPFIGNKRMRFALGDGYVEALHQAWGELPETLDFVFYWWCIAAGYASDRKLKRFGLITTNSISQSTCRKVVDRFIGGTGGLAMLYAVPDHPWVDDEGSASVRIAMTVVGGNSAQGVLDVIDYEHEGLGGEHDLRFNRRIGVIQSDLRIGHAIHTAVPLRSNEDMSFMGVTLVGDFRVSQAERNELIAEYDDSLKGVLKPYIIGRELAQSSQNNFVIDLFGLSSDEASRQYPQLVQRVIERVKPLRDQNKRKSYKDKWWIFGEPRGRLRDALRDLPRFIATPETSKHRFFTFLNTEVVPDHTVFAVPSSDAFVLAALTSRIHTVWSLTVGGWMGVGNDPRYRNGPCFLPFPFPDCSEAQKARIRELGEQLDAHRKRQQALHPKLTLTDMYNVLEKLRSGAELTAKEKKTHEEGLVSVLKQIHDDWTPPCSTPTVGRPRSPMKRFWSGWSRSTPSAPPKRPAASCAGSAPSFKTRAA